MNDFSSTALIAEVAAQNDERRDIRIAGDGVIGKMAAPASAQAGLSVTLPISRRRGCYATWG